MSEGSQLTPARIRELAQANRVTKDPEYHADQKGFKFADLVDYLSWCFRAEKDQRRDHDGGHRHPNGYLAWCHASRSRVVRIDFNRGIRDDGELVLLVTEMWIE